MPPNSHIPIIPTPPPHVIGVRPRARALGWGVGHMGWGVGIMGMWEFGGTCELFCKLLCKLPRVGIRALLFTPTTTVKILAKLATEV